jgi:Holliday junction resolvase RusA-like endonuclease
MERGGELLRLTIYGQAAGSGSKTAEVVTKKGPGPGGRVPVMDGNRYILRYRPSSKYTAPWMRAVEREARIAWAELDPLDGSLWLDVLFYELRPSTHYFDRKGGRVLRPDAPAYPSRTDTHDADKMRRAISDSLTNAGVIVDDKRVIGGEHWKDYVENLPADAEGREPKAVIVLGRMKAQTVADLGITSPAPDGQQSLVD